MVPVFRIRRCRYIRTYMCVGDKSDVCSVKKMNEWKKLLYISLDTRHATLLRAYT
jgi:hypothetical protein